MKKLSIFVYIFVLLCTSTNYAQEIISSIGSPVFQSLTNDDGLSQGAINAIAQDELGFMWFGTKDGLNRYDGYEVKVFRNIIGDTTTISSNYINDLKADQQGHLWIATINGLNCYIAEKGIFRKIDVPFVGKDRIINKIEFDQSGHLWIGTQTSGLIRYDTAARSFRVYVQLSGDPSTLSSNTIRSLYASPGGKVWAGTEARGLDCLDPSTGLVKQYRHVAGDPDSMNDYLVMDIAGDSDNNLWLATYGNSLIYMDTRQQKFTKYHQLPPFSKTTLHTVICLCMQGSDTLWVGSDSDGLYCFNIPEKKLAIYHQGFTENSLLYNTIASLFVDHHRNLWIGTNGKGISMLSPYAKQFYAITNKNREPVSLAFSSVRSIYEDKDRVLWVGGYSSLQRIDLVNHRSEEVVKGIIYSICPDPQNSDLLWLGEEGGGLWLFNKRTRRYRKIPFHVPGMTTKYEKHKLYGARIFEITPGPDGKLYIGTEHGLNRFDPVTETVAYFEHIPGDSTSLVAGRIATICFDNNGVLWAGSMSGGLSRYNQASGTFTSFRSAPAPQSLPSDQVNCIYHDSKNRLWVATAMGLSLMYEKSGKFITWDETDGLPNNVVYGILEDRYGRLWLSTNLGISCFNPQTLEFNNFNSNDGLPGNEFNGAAYFRSGYNRFYFGGVNGLVVFDPDQIRLNPNPPNVVFTNLTAYGRDTTVIYDIAYRHRIVVQPDVNLISLGFSALNFINPHNCSYAYKIDESGNRWLDLGHNRSMTLTYLEPGTHHINIKASNNDGVWAGQSSEILLVVMPRFYQTTWFKLLLGILGLFIATAIVLGRLNSIRRQKRKLQQRVNQKTEELRVANAKLKQANATKDKFVSIIAHDLKNPFNSLMGLSEILEQDWDEMPDPEKLQMVKLMKNTSADTYQLLVNLLDWSRIQKDQIDFKPQAFSISQLVNNAYYQIKANAMLKNLLVKIEIDPQLLVYADMNMVDTILRNLLSNAIKFTPRHGRIVITALTGNDGVTCCIEDNGVGMAKDVADALFTDETPVSSTGTGGETGTGLGLVLCREFVKRNNGRIWVESEPGKGSRFCFSLPQPAEQESQELHWQQNSGTRTEMA